MFKFSQRTIKEVIASEEVIHKYLEFRSSLSPEARSAFSQGSSAGEYPSGASEPQSLTEWVLAIAEGECGPFSLHSSVLSVIDAAIFHNRNTYTSLVEKATEDCTQNLEKLENQKLKDKLVRMNIQFAADPENLETGIEPEIQQTVKIPLTDWMKDTPVEETKKSTGCNELTMEQSFAVTAFKNTITKISLEQAKELLAQYYQTILVRESLYKQSLLNLIKR